MRSQPLLALSVTWEGPSASAAAEVAAALTAFDLPATWIVGEQPAPAKFLSGQELGLSVPPGLLAAERARSVVVETLVRARQRAARLGAPCTTLVAERSPSARHAELMAKYGIRCLTDAPQRGGQAVPGSEPRNFRYGLWHIPVALAWPWSSARGWFRSASLERALRQAATPRGLLHVRIDVSALEQGGRAGLARLARDIEQLAGTARHLGLTASTLAGAAEKLSCPRPRVEPARSILRAA